MAIVPTAEYNKVMGYVNTLHSVLYAGFVFCDDHADMDGIEDLAETLQAGEIALYRLQKDLADNSVTL